MEIKTYRATLKHDKGKVKLRVTSLSGEEGAIEMIMAVENCPRCAIIKIKELKPKKRRK
jgi:hypothetical protein